MAWTFAPIATVVAVVFLVWGHAEAAAPFGWISEKQNPKVWSQVRLLLRAELEPEDPAKTAPRVAFIVKYVARIAIVEDIALAIVNMQDETKPPFNYFKAYSLDLTSRTVVPLVTGGFPNWRFVKWARMSRGQVLDAVFRYDSCFACEATYLLSAAFFDRPARQWRVRDWPHDGGALFIGADPEPGTSGTRCLFAVADFTQDGLEDIAVWCRSTAVNGRTRVDTLEIYTISDTGAERRLAEGPQRTKIVRRMCQGNLKSVLCR